MGRDTHYDHFKKEKSSTLKKPRRFLEFLILKTLQHISYLFPVRWNQKFGALIGRVALKLAKKDRGIAEYQLDFCFPELSIGERQSILKQTFRNVGITLFETLVLKKIKKKPEKWIHFENEPLLCKARSEEKGLIMLFGHVGNWELYPTIFDMLGITGVAISAKIGDSKLDSFLLDSRSSNNLRTVQRGERATAKEILTCLRNKEILLIAIDQDTRIKTVYVDFFGRKAATAVGPATFAQKFNCPVLSGYGVRRNDGTHLIRFEKLSNGPYAGTEEETESLTQKYSQALENHIRSFPDQWVWFHRRWKNQPET